MWRGVFTGPSDLTQGWDGGIKKGKQAEREREKKKNIESDINVEAGLRKLRCTGYQMCLTHKVLSE